MATKPKLQLVAATTEPMVFNPLVNPYERLTTAVAYQLDASGYALRQNTVVQNSSLASPQSSPRKTRSQGQRIMATESELTDAKIRAANAETDTKIARIEGKIDTAMATLGAKLDVVNERLSDHAKDRNLILGTIALAALAVIAAFIALATYGDALFGRGMNVRDVVQAIQKEAAEAGSRQQSPAPPVPPVIPRPTTPK